MSSRTHIYNLAKDSPDERDMTIVFPRTIFERKTNKVFLRDWKKLSNSNNELDFFLSFDKSSYSPN